MEISLLNPLRAYRIERRLSLSELADAAGLTRAVMVAVENGQALLTHNQAVDIAQYLRVDLQELAAYVAPRS